MAVTGEAAQIMDALLARCATLAVGSPVLMISYPEVPFTPPASGKYLQVDFFANRPAWEGLSSGKQAQGLLQITVIWPRGQGIIQAGQAAQSVMDHFAKGLNLLSGTTKVTINKEPWDASPMTDDAGLRIPITIPWVAAQISA
jgi:hypothetical protein